MIHSDLSSQSMPNRDSCHFLLFFSFFLGSPQKFIGVALKKNIKFFQKSLVIRVRLWYIAINKNSRALFRQLSCESVTL